MRTPQLQLFASFILALVIVACAPASAGSGPASDPDVLLGEEISDGQFNSAFEAVQRLRPRWLRSRPNVSLDNELAQINVYVDNVQRGGVEVLQTISSGSVERIDWIDATTATQRWGMGNTVGAIAVTLRRGG